MDSKTIVITTTLRNLTLTEGLEPPTSRLTVERANQLRHASKNKTIMCIAETFFDASQIKSLVQKELLYGFHMDLFNALSRHKPHTGLEPVALGLKVLCSTN